MPSEHVFRKAGILALGYLVTGWLGLSLAVPPGYATAVWPPSGIALAGILWWGPRVWPGIWLGSFAVNLWVSFSAPDAHPGPAAILIAASIGVGSTLQALLGALLIRRLVGVEKISQSAPATFSFAGIVALCCLLASTWGVMTLRIAGSVDHLAFLESWRTWWLGDLIGVLVVTPALLNWHQLLPYRGSNWYIAETAAVLALLVAVTGGVFFYQSPDGAAAYPLSFLPLPFLAWIACRNSPGAVSFAACLVSAIAIVATSMGHGPFARGSINESLLLLQGFTGLTTLTALALAATVAGHRHSTDSLRKLSVDLEQLASTDELTGLANRRGFLLLADRAWAEARQDKVRCLLMFVDVDGLKQINDTQGHLAGDALLIDAARVLNQVFGDSDVIGRIGGDEFAVLARAVGHGAVDSRSLRLQECIDEFNRTAGRPYRLSMSFGVEELPAGVDAALDFLLSRADHAMYDRKRERGTG